MPEIKCVKSKEKLSPLVWQFPFPEKALYMNVYSNLIEEFQRWVTPAKEEYPPISKVLEPETSKKIISLLKKVDEHLTLIKDRPLIRDATLRDLNSRKYFLKENLEILIEEYPDEIITQWPEVEIFGHGATQPEAMLDLKNEIIDLYEDLLKTKKRELGRLPKMWLRILNRIIKKNE